MSLDPESLLGVKIASIKTVAAGLLSGILFRREFTLREVLASATAGFGAGLFLAPAFNALLKRWLGDFEGFSALDTAVLFVCGVGGIYIYGGLTTYAPAIIRAVIRKFVPLDPAPPPAGTDKSGGGA